MSWADTFRFAARSVLRRPGRAALTVVAVALAAALFTAMLTMAATAQGRVLNQLAKGGPTGGYPGGGGGPGPVPGRCRQPGPGCPKPIDQASPEPDRPDPGGRRGTAHRDGPDTGRLARPHGDRRVTVPGRRGPAASSSTRWWASTSRVCGDFPVTLSAGRFPAPGSVTQVDVTPVLLARYGITGPGPVSVVGSQIVLGAPRGFRSSDGTPVFRSRWTKATIVGVVTQQAGSGGILASLAPRPGRPPVDGGG